MDQAVIDMLKEHGYSRQDIQLMLDLANKIQQDTMDLVWRIADSAPENMQMQVTLLGFMAIERRLKSANDTVRNVFREAGMSL